MAADVNHRDLGTVRMAGPLVSFGETPLQAGPLPALGNTPMQSLGSWVIHNLRSTNGVRME